jgi:hypothetical protein
MKQALRLDKSFLQPGSDASMLPRYRFSAIRLCHLHGQDRRLSLGRNTMDKARAAAMASEVR